MKINSINYTAPSFKKTLFANTAYLKDNVVSPAKIYELNSEEDKNYIIHLYAKDEWDLNKYIDRFVSNFGLKQEYEEKNPDCKLNFFTMEDENENCLGLVQLETNKEKKETNINFFEVCPKYASTNKDRKSKYIGETLLTFVVNYVQQFLKTNLTVNFPSPSAKKFYTNSCFLVNQNHLACIGYYMPQKDVPLLTLKNKNRTNVGVNFVG